jgi:hypothetical protein
MTTIVSAAPRRGIRPRQPARSPELPLLRRRLSAGRALAGKVHDDRVLPWTSLSVCQASWLNSTGVSTSSQREASTSLRQRRDTRAL